MIHMIQKAKEQVLSLTMAAYEQAAAEGLLPEGVQVNAGVEIPKDTANGDYTTTFALAAAKAMKKNPRELAGILAERMALEGSYFTTVEIAGPGFLNFRLGSSWYREVLKAVESEGADYGSSDMLKGQRIMVEFVSANPTGPMHMGNARGGVLGDTLAAVLERCGAEVSREFYVNDAGNQIEKFANSLEARYLQLIYGEEQVPFPEDGYHGDDIRELAKAFYELHGESFKDADVTVRHEALAKFGLEHNIPKMQSDLKRYGIEYDRWFFESELHESGYVAETVEELTKRGYTYEKDGALWLKTAEIMRETLLKAGKKQADVDKLELKDDVLRRANGFYTYFAADIAYHRNKFARGFDRCINVWGADHHGHVARMKGSLDALGLNGSERLDIVLMQLVKLVRDGELVRMSKRTGKAISLTDLLDEIPVDACRYFFNMSKPESQMEFDLGLAVREDSENPVYYVQYAHARICSLLRQMQEEGLTVAKADEIHMELLMGEVEQTLVKELANYCEELKIAARDYDPSHVNRYLVGLASAFHKFYNACRIKGEEPAVAQARLTLADCVRSVLKNGMELIGCTAPERM